MDLRLLDTRLAVCRLDADAGAPRWFSLDAPLSVAVRRGDELSLVVDDALVPDGVVAERGWRALEVAGPLDLSMTGVMAGLSALLAEAGVALFAVATYDTDVLLVRDGDVDRAVAALRSGGHSVAL